MKTVPKIYQWLLCTYAGMWQMVTSSTGNQTGFFQSIFIQQRTSQGSVPTYMCLTAPYKLNWYVPFYTKTNAYTFCQTLLRLTYIKRNVICTAFTIPGNLDWHTKQTPKSTHIIWKWLIPFLGPKQKTRLHTFIFWGDGNEGHGIPPPFNIAAFKPFLLWQMVEQK